MGPLYGRFPPITCYSRYLLTALLFHKGTSLFPLIAWAPEPCKVLSKWEMVSEKAHCLSGPCSLSADLRSFCKPRVTVKRQGEATGSHSSVVCTKHTGYRIRPGSSSSLFLAHTGDKRKPCQRLSNLCPERFMEGFLEFIGTKTSLVPLFLWNATHWVSYTF